MSSTILRLYMVLCFACVFCSSATDIIQENAWILDEPGVSLISAEENFELGFFTPSGAPYGNRYVGIWYYKSNPQVVVWVANRDHPLLDYKGSFAVSDGNLKVLDAMDKPLWSTELGSPNSTTPLVAMLEDSGNLVLRDEHSKRILWQSFDNPTDTFLKGMILNENTTLTSWRDQHDPGTGNYTFKERKGQYVILFNEIIQHWGSEDIFSNSDTTGDDAFELVIKNQNLAESPTRLVMNCTGELQFQSWDGKKWSILWQEPRDKCSVSNACGDFGSCNINNQLMCKCLPGFEPRSLDAWNSGDFSTGCTRKSFSDCKNDSFLSLRLMKVGNTETQVPKKTEEECKAQCLSSCTQCQAYAFQNSTLRTRAANSTCYIWLENLNNLQEEYAPAGDVIISVRVAVSYLGL